MLGQLIHDPQPLRLRDLADHESSVGFPPGHPPMKSFLGAPVRIREQVLVLKTLYDFSSPAFSSSESGGGTILIRPCGR